MLLSGKLKSWEKGALEAEATEAAPCWPANNAVLEIQRTGLKWNLVGGYKGGGKNWTCQLLSQKWNKKGRDERNEAACVKVSPELCW